jgi:hypothetical protein
VVARVAALDTALIGHPAARSRRNILGYSSSARDRRFCSRSHEALRRQFGAGPITTHRRAPLRVDLLGGGGQLWASHAKTTTLPDKWLPDCALAVSTEGTRDKRAVDLARAALPSARRSHGFGVPGMDLSARQSWAIRILGSGQLGLFADRGGAIPLRQGRRWATGARFSAVGLRERRGSIQ